LVVWSCIAPHGGEVIPELAGADLKRMAHTREGMRELGARCLAAAPDTIVIYTPHGLAQEGIVTVSLSPCAHGNLEGEGGGEVRVDFEVDQEFAATLVNQASALGIPLGGAVFTGESELAPTFPLDWGVTVPLWFMGAHWPQKPRIVVVCPSRALPRGLLVAFGLATARTAEALGRRTAIIASADHGHGHTSDGPYGFSPTSAEYDSAFCEAVRANRLGNLLDWDDDWVQSALADSYWQVIMLYGAQLHTPMEAELITYEAPTYFGMACAALQQVVADGSRIDKAPSHRP
jgi:aromatic ring-opening dioxygenase LigB subunit